MAETDDENQATQDGIELLDGSHTRVCALKTDGEHYDAEMIHYAAQDGLVDVVASQIDAGIDPDLATAARGWTPLHYASYNGRSAVVELLLERNATLECRSLSNRTPLMLARLGNHDKVVTQLADTVCRSARSNPRWVRSWEATSCMRCTMPFSFFVPKHHCRRCGCSVCGSCSAGTLVLDQWLAPIKPHELRKSISETPQRVCDGCLKYYTKELPEADNKDQHSNGIVTTTAEDPRMQSRDDLQLLRALALWNPSLIGWVSIEASDGTQLLQMQPAPIHHSFTDWDDCSTSCGFGRVYKVVSDARVRAECDMGSKLVGVLRAGDVFTSLETRVTGYDKTRVSIPLISPSIQTHQAAMGTSFAAELSREYVRAHSSYNAADSHRHNLEVGDILLVRLGHDVVRVEACL